MQLDVSEGDDTRATLQEAAPRLAEAIDGAWRRAEAQAESWRARIPT